MGSVGGAEPASEGGRGQRSTKGPKDAGQVRKEWLIDATTERPVQRVLLCEMNEAAIYPDQWSVVLILLVDQWHLYFVIHSFYIVK